MSANKKSIIWSNLNTPKECANFLGEKIAKTINNSEKKVLFLVSGGSAFSVLPFVEIKDFEKVTISLIDERFDKTNNDNNFSQLEKINWFKNFVRNGGLFISTKVLEKDTQEILAKRFENDVKNWMSENPKGEIIALFGMGSDGHTAGILPFLENKNLFSDLFDGKNIVASYDALGKNKFTKRITLTNLFFKKIELGFLFACGSEKKQALLKFRNENNNENEIPVIFLKNLKNLHIATDFNLN